MRDWYRFAGTSVVEEVKLEVPGNVALERGIPGSVLPRLEAFQHSIGDRGIGFSGIVVSDEVQGYTDQGFGGQVVIEFKTRVESRKLFSQFTVV